MQLGFGDSLRGWIVPMLIMVPPYAIMFLRDRLMRYYIVLTGGNYYTARFLLTLTFAFSFVVVAIIAMVLYLAALSRVSGQRYLIGHAYDRRGIAKPVTLALGEYSEIGKIRGDDGSEWLVYVVWRLKGENRVADYVLLTKERLEDALVTSSAWSIESTGGFFVRAAVYPVTLLQAEGQAVDVLREDAGLDPGVPIYFLRDYPGRIAKRLQEEVKKHVK